MIYQDIYLTHADWHVCIFFITDNSSADEIIDALISLGCSGNELTIAKRKMWNAGEGLVYTNRNEHESIMVINVGRTSEEFYRNAETQKLALLRQIAKAFGLDPFFDYVGYISGELTHGIYGDVKHLPCDNCRKKVFGSA